MILMKNFGSLLHKLEKSMCSNSSDEALIFLGQASMGIRNYFQKKLEYSM